MNVCNESAQNSNVLSIREVYSEKRRVGAGSDEMISDKGQLLFEQDANFDEMRSAEDVPHE